MKNKRPNFAYPQNMQGFSLIEFLVASALSMIVLMAVTSTYFTARNLNNAAGARLSVQQDLRNASTLIVRDARMAGSFGCFNMAGYAASAILADDSKAPFNLAANPSKTSLIPISTTKVSYPGFSGSSDSLTFQYGTDSSKPGSIAVAASCSEIAKSNKIKDLTSAKSALKISGTEKDGTISVLKHVVVAYAVGSIKGQQGLYRFQMNDSGVWGEPQLLMKNITSMTTNYLYVENCPENISASATTAENFTSESALRTGDNAITPALVHIRLNGGSVAASTDNDVQIYNIDANVRGGNVCANRSI